MSNFFCNFHNQELLFILELNNKNKIIVNKMELIKTFRLEECGHYIPPPSFGLMYELNVSIKQLKVKHNISKVLFWPIFTF